MVDTTQDGYSHFNFVPTVCKMQWNQNHRMLLVGLYSGKAALLTVWQNLEK